MKYESVQGLREIWLIDLDIVIDERWCREQVVMEGEPFGRESDGNLEPLQPVGDPHVRRYLRGVVLGKLVVPDLYHQHAKGADALGLPKLRHI